MSVVSVTDLEVVYEVEEGQVNAVDGVSFNIDRGKIVGLLGESGCGKSTLARAIVRALASNASIERGQVLLDGEDITSMSPDRLREVRWEKIAYIPQSAMASLDPVYTIRDQLLETITAHRSIPTKECMDRIKEVLDIVGIDESRLNAYPHELSGGMKQRVILAMSFMLEPDLIVADEPTTGVDVLVRDKILYDLEQYRDEFDVSILYISHDIANLVETSDELLVMYGGKLVETGPSREVFNHPSHPYTIGLQNSLPILHSHPDEMITMDMDPPDLRSPPEGCRFIEKCPYAISDCEQSHPDFFSSNGTQSACYRVGDAEDLRNRAQEVSWVNE